MLLQSYDYYLVLCSPFLKIIITSPESLHFPYEPLTISSKFFFVHLRSQYSDDLEDKKKPTGEKGLV